jgi:hypothetical protein
LLGGQQGTEWMRTLGLAPGAAYWALEVPTVKAACRLSQSRGCCHRSHGWRRDRGGLSRTPCCKSRECSGMQSLCLLEWAAIAAYGRIACIAQRVSAGRKECPCGAAPRPIQGIGSVGFRQRDTTMNIERRFTCVRVAVAGKVRIRRFRLSVASAYPHRN